MITIDGVMIFLKSNFFAEKEIYRIKPQGEFVDTPSGVLMTRLREVECRASYGTRMIVMKKNTEDTAIYIAYDDHQAFDPARPERELLRAVLMSALSDVKKSGGIHEEARQFFLSEEDDYIFSFRSICFFLNVDPSKILVLTGLSEEEIKEQENSRHQFDDMPLS